jgi:hypothetical protein
MDARRSCRWETRKHAPILDSGACDTDAGKSLCRAAGLIPEWGAIHWTHSKIITKVGGREMEARDCARAALQMPLWTIGPDLKQVMILSLPDCSMGVKQVMIL